MRTSPGTLFIIDDDPQSRKAMAALASSMKIKSEAFASAEEFLDRYDPSLAGCALVDFRLGGMDGLQLQDRLRVLGSGLCVVLISAYADVPLAVRAIQSGAAAVIEKPYRNDDLADAIRKGLDCGRHVREGLAAQADEGRQQRFIAHDLHDGVVQYLAGAVMHLEDYERQHGEQREEAAAEFQTAVGLIRRSIDELRSLIRGVHVATSQKNIVDALQELVAEFQERVAIELVCDPKPAQLESWVTGAIYRMVQESLTNACRHSKSPKVRIELRQYGSQFCVDVRDWGTGFDVKNIELGRFGLHGIRERARLLGGEAVVKSTRGEGTCVSVRIPLAPSAAQLSS